MHCHSSDIAVGEAPLPHLNPLAVEASITLCSRSALGVSLVANFTQFPSLSSNNSSRSDPREQPPREARASPSSTLNVGFDT